jgi:hypothetical protein
MVEGVKDRIEKIERMVMDVESKPNKAEVKELVQLFTYMLLIPNTEKVKINLLAEIANKSAIFNALLESFHKTIST